MSVKNRCPHNMTMTTAWGPRISSLLDQQWAFVESPSICVQKTFKNLHGPWWHTVHRIVNWHLQSRQPQSCHVQSHAGHRTRPPGHLWRRGRPAQGPSAPLSVWMTALWAGHGLGAGDHAHIETTAAATATRCPRRARHWPAWPGKHSNEKVDELITFLLCTALDKICFFYNLTIRKHYFLCECLLNIKTLIKLSI